MRKILMVIAIVLLSNALVAQGNKSVYIELGGNGIGLSANFDARFKKTEKGFGFRLGIGVVPGVSIGSSLFSSSAVLTIPVGVNYLIGNAPSYFEGGLGLTYISGSFSLFGGDEERSSGAGFIPSAGYRFAPSESAFQGRIFISPIIADGGAVFWGGISGGYKF